MLESGGVSILVQGAGEGTSATTQSMNGMNKRVGVLGGGQLGRYDQIL